MLRKRLDSLTSLALPVLLLLLGIELLTAGAAALLRLFAPIAYPSIAYYLTLAFLPAALRITLLGSSGIAVLAAGLWILSNLVVIRRSDSSDTKELVLGYSRTEARPRIVVLSGGAGMFIMANLVQQVERLTCITPLQDPVEYYYRASSLFNSEPVDYMPPTPTPAEVIAELDNGMRVDLREIRRVVTTPAFAQNHVEDLELRWSNGNPSGQRVARVVLDAIAEADAIVLGPGSLFESILPNLLLEELSEAIRRSSARTIFVCNLMTEPGLTSGFGVDDHVHTIKRFGHFTPDYVLVNAQRIDPEVRQLYEAADQVPVLLDPEAYEETTVRSSELGRRTELLVEGAVAIEADLASALVQYTAAISNPNERRAVRVLRHDPDKLAAAILALLRRE